MKRSFILLLLTSTVTISTVSSCKKDLQVASVHPGSGPGTGTSLYTANLKADNWINAGDGIFVNTFRNIIPSRYYGRSTKIYLLTDDREIQINHYINFKGGELWASVSGTDVTIIYHCTGQLLFSSLNIKMLIE